jgi:GRAM domain
MTADDDSTADDAVAEEPLRDGPANLQRGWETVGGRLFLTTRRLVFEPHGLNAQQHRFVLRLTDIDAVSKCWTKLLGLIPVAPNSLAVEARDGTTYKFVLVGRGAWAEAILDAIDRAEGREPGGAT